MVTSDGLFDRDGFFANFLEKVPFLGFVVAGLHALGGNPVGSFRNFDQTIGFITNR
jgi:hypothetical protein